MIVTKIETREITEYAKDLGVDLCIVERPPGWGARFFAYFQHTEEKRGHCLAGISGDGSTPDEAIAEYAKQISGKLMIINAFSDKRQEVPFPKLVHTKLLNC